MPKVMIVEDDNNLREIYTDALSAEGLTVVSAADGEEALATAVKEQPDLIILDVMMPKISGFDVLDILRSTPETKNAKIMMMTALSQQSDKERGERLGADRYLVKSQVTIPDIISHVTELLSDVPAAPAVEAPGDSTDSAAPEINVPGLPVNNFGEDEAPASPTTDDADDGTTDSQVPVPPVATPNDDQAEVTDETTAVANPEPPENPELTSSSDVPSPSSDPLSATETNEDAAVQPEEITPAPPSMPPSDDSQSAAPEESSPEVPPVPTDDTEAVPTPSEESPSAIGEPVVEADQAESAPAMSEPAVSEEDNITPAPAEQSPDPTNQPATTDANPVAEPNTEEEITTPSAETPSTEPAPAPTYDTQNTYSDVDIPHDTISAAADSLVDDEVPVAPDTDVPAPAAPPEETPSEPGGDQDETTPDAMSTAPEVETAEAAIEAAMSEESEQGPATPEDFVEAAKNAIPSANVTTISVADGDEPVSAPQDDSPLVETAPASQEAPVEASPEVPQPTTDLTDTPAPAVENVPEPLPTDDTNTDANPLQPGTPIMPPAGQVIEPSAPASEETLPETTVEPTAEPPVPTEEDSSEQNQTSSQSRANMDINPHDIAL